MKEGLVSFQKVRDWGRLECQRHICEIQGTPRLISKPRPAEATGCMDTGRAASLLVSGAGVAWI